LPRVLAPSKRQGCLAVVGLDIPGALEALDRGSLALASRSTLRVRRGANACSRRGPRCARAEELAALAYGVHSLEACRGRHGRACGRRQGPARFARRTDATLDRVLGPGGGLVMARRWGSARDLNRAPPCGSWFVPRPCSNRTGRLPDRSGSGRSNALLASAGP